MKSNGHMQADAGNFSTFTSSVPTATPEAWKQHNDNRYENHPEFGIRAFGAPEENVIEIFSKRTANERFFINPENPAEFYQQTSYGPLHYEVNGDWVSINPSLLPSQNGIYEASNQPEPVGFNILQKQSYIKTAHGNVGFNNWTLYGVKNGVEQFLTNANWSDFTAGDNGIYINNVFPGIDLKMHLYQSAIKADFIVKELLFTDLDYLLFKDEFDSNGTFKQNESSPAEYLNPNGVSMLTIGDAVVYPMNAPKEEMIVLDYKMEKNILGIAIPFNWLQEKVANGFVVIDPFVSTTTILAQGLILGSQYNASCNFDNYCNYVLTANTPSNSTVTNIVAHFSYAATGQCWLYDGAMRFSLNNCLSPSETGFFWFCPFYYAGNCNGTNTPVWSDFASCVPAPSCTPTPLQFNLRFYRRCYGTLGCTSGCISASSTWTMVIQGYTFQHPTNNPTQQITLSSTSVCQGGTVTATSNSMQYGVAPYNVNWSLSSTGIPSIGTGSPVSFDLNNLGANTIYCIVTDACGNTITSSRNVTVTNAPAGPAVTSPINLCLNSIATPLTVPIASPIWYATAAGNTPIAAPTPNTSSAGTTSYWVSQMVGNCESALTQVDVVVMNLPIISGVPVVTASECSAATGVISGLTTNAPQPVTYTWLDNVGGVLSTSTTNSDLIGQPAGSYSLMVTGANGCQATQSGFIITNQANPSPPVVSSPISYCQNAAATALVAAGNNIMWYELPTPVSGSPVAPVPSTASPGATTYYVTQTVGGCESLQVGITVQIVPTPPAPIVVTPVVYCHNSVTSELTASGTDLLWYAALTGGTGSANPPSISSNIVGLQGHYVSQTVNGCESLRALINVEIIALPTFSGTPVITPSACDQNTGGISGVNVMVGSNTTNTFSWVNSAGIEVGTALSLTNQPIGSYTLVVTDQDFCSASYGPITIPLVNPPAPPLVPSPVAYCQGSVAAPLTATGSNILWYTDAVGGVGSTMAPTPLTDNVGSISYYVTQTVYGCESARNEVIVNIVDLPDAEFALAAQEGCAPYCVTFQNLSTPNAAPIVSYEWSANGEIFSNEQAPNHCFSIGMYSINLLVTDAIGCTRAINKQNYLTVVPGPPPPIVVTPVVYCQNSATSELVASGTDLLWYAALTGGTGSTNPPTISSNIAGLQSHYVSQTVNGCESLRALINVQIIALPTFSGTPVITPSACDQNTGGISGVNVIVGSNTMNTFSWVNSAGIQVGTALSLTNQPIGSYTLVVTDQDFCSASYGPITIPLVNPPAPPMASSLVEYCQGSVAAPLTATGSNILWYTDAVGGVGSTMAPTPPTDNVGSTSYYVTQTVNGCESIRREVVVHVVDSPGAEFTLATQLGCAPYCVAFQNLSTPAAAPIISYEWSANGEVFSNEQAPNHCFSTGMYSINLLVTDAIGCTKTINKQNYLTVVPGPVSSFSKSRAEASEDDGLIVFTSINPRPTETVIWSFGEGNIDTAWVASHVFTEAGRYCISQTVTSIYGCSDRSEQCVLITSDFYLYVPNAFTPTGDGINDAWKPEIKGKFTSYRLNIFNRWGESVFSTNDIDTPWVGDVANGDYFYAPDGTYHFIIVLEDEEKILKEYRGYIQLLR